MHLWKGDISLPLYQVKSVERPHSRAMYETQRTDVGQGSLKDFL